VSRIRARYVALALATILVGLFVHRWASGLAPAVRDFFGDALWAAMIVWWIGAIAPRASLLARGGVALGVCFAVETSQLYHSPAIDSLRSTTLGSLVLGSGFDSRDLIAYTAGVVAALLVDRLFVARKFL
jgi:hypothetical protein